MFLYGVNLDRWSSSEGFWGLEVDVLIVSMKGKGEDKHACVVKECTKNYRDDIVIN